MNTQLAPTTGNFSEFQPGSSVIYGLHGKCHILGTEIRTLDGKPTLFYKLQIHRTQSPKTGRGNVAIWVPASNAKALGLRNPMNAEIAQQVLQILSEKEYFFPLQDSWANLHPKLEHTIRTQGALGLAQAASFLYVFTQKQNLPPPGAVQFHETVHRLLLRELSEALHEYPKSLEARLHKLMRVKLQPSH